MVHFSNIFHHRWLTQFWQAWRSAQSAGGGLDKPEHDRLRLYRQSQRAGSTESAESSLSDHVPPAASRPSGVRESRNPDGLAATCWQRFQRITQWVKEFALHWITVQHEITRSGTPAQSSVLGNGRLFTSAVPDMQYKFRLIIGPLGWRITCVFARRQQSARADMNRCVRSSVLNDGWKCAAVEASFMPHRLAGRICAAAWLTARQVKPCTTVR
ncbi:type VI secretion system baseplate subunit TssG [Salmonella enterica subsp. enterica]|nr:type VI secretion system baseplate subunit TssG [Salmonella enterica subsp. enterica]